MNRRTVGLGRGSEGAWTSVATRTVLSTRNCRKSLDLRWNGTRKISWKRRNRETEKQRKKRKHRNLSGLLLVKETRSYARSSFPRFSLVFQVQRSVTSLMTLLSTQYKTPRHPSLQIKPIHRILNPRVILSVPTPSFTCTHCFKFVRHVSVTSFTRRQSVYRVLLFIN